MANSIAEEIMEKVNILPLELQRKVLEYARDLGVNAQGHTQHASGTDLSRFTGTISDEDADIMLKGIEEAFERVDISEW